MALKTDLFRTMIDRNMEKTTMRALANFLKIYIPFAKPEAAFTFKQHLQTFTSNTDTMGIEEQILNITEQRGVAKGKAEGKVEEVQNLIIKLGLDDAKAADIAGVYIEFVQQVRADLDSEAKN